MAETIGFMGIGIIGRGMVANLVAKGFDVRIFARDAAKARAASSELRMAATPSILILAHGCDVLMFCVADTADVQELLFGSAGDAEHLRPGSLVVDCGTISPDATRAIAHRLKRQGVGFIDAPVSGGCEGAARGTLAIMAGGDGQATKLLNQVLVVVNMLAVSDALLLGRAAGLDVQRVLPVLEAGAGGSWTLSNRALQVLKDYWDPGFTIDLQQKDLRLVLELGARLGIPLIATGVISQLYSTLQRQGIGNQGNQALIRALEPLTK